MRVGVVGCGYIARFHLHHILRHRHVQAVSIADVNRQRAAALGRQFKVNSIYTDFEMMIKERKLDIVHVLTPPATHAEIAIRAMESGCHVLVEKPMTLTSKDADSMVVASRRNGVKLCVDHNNLWQPLLVKSRSFVEEGRIGRVVHVDVSYFFDIERMHGTDSYKWKWISGLPGGIVFDCLPHPVSILMDFLKGPVNIWAVAKSNGTLSGGMPDELRAHFDTADATGYLSVSLGIKPDCVAINIYGTKMSVHVNLSNLTLVTRRNTRMAKIILRPFQNVQQAVQLLSCTVINSLKVLMGRMPLPDDVGPVIRRFYDSIENNKEPPVTGEEGRSVVKVTEQILERIK